MRALEEPSMHHHMHNHHTHHHHHHHWNTTTNSYTPKDPRAMIIAAAASSVFAVAFCTVFITIVVVFGRMGESPMPLFMFFPFLIVPLLIIGGTIFNLIRTIRLANNMKANPDQTVQSEQEPPHAYEAEGQDHRFDFNQNDDVADKPRSAEEKANDMIVCPHCGFINMPGTKFCAQCGTNLADK